MQNLPTPAGGRQAPNGLLHLLTRRCLVERSAPGTVPYKLPAYGLPALANQTGRIDRQVGTHKANIPAAVKRLLERAAIDTNRDFVAEVIEKRDQLLSAISNASAAQRSASALRGSDR